MNLRQNIAHAPHLTPRRGTRDEVTCPRLEQLCLSLKISSFYKALHLTETLKLHPQIHSPQEEILKRIKVICNDFSLK